MAKKEDDRLDSYPELTQTLLKNRNIKTRAEAEKFLNPDYEAHTYDPFLILNMEKAVERILGAISSNQKIVIYGDYDCDGIPGSVILHDFFKKIGYKNFINYIPHRHTEGYGLNNEAIEGFAKDNTSLLITVDCGITDVSEVSLAKDLGIDVIITDHHLPQETLPMAFTILNSKQKGDEYPDKMLCGAGLAWKLVQALIRRGKEKKVFEISDGWEKWLLDMAGLATIADMVPLKDENRVIASFGLKVLRKSPRLGLRRLLEKIKVDQRHLTEDDVGFMIAPRINAASRLDTPIEAFNLLSTSDSAEAERLASHLNKINDDRKWMVANVLKEIKHTLSSREEKEVIVIGNPDWRVGILGIAANNLVEEYGKPAFVWGRGESRVIKGSCRSDGSVNLVELMTSVSEGVFLDVGGHELSGGFSVSHEKIHLLESEILVAYEKSKRDKEEKEILIDKKMLLSEVNWKNWKEIERFAPFGMENPKPVFKFEKAEISGIKKFGKEKKHLELILKDENDKNIPLIWFFADVEEASDLETGRKIDFLASFDKSVFGRRENLRLRMVKLLN